MGFFQNTAKPIGFGGKLMVKFMNIGHAKVAEWGFSHVNIPSSATVLIAIGAILIRGNWILFFLIPLYWLFMTFLMKNTEEKWLIAIFGKAKNTRLIRIEQTGAFPGFQRNSTKEWVLWM